jgi:predicted nucleic acid-binding protein
MIVVSNTSPIIGLAAIGCLDLLKRLYDCIITPDAVYQELTVAGKGQPGSSEVRSSDWIVSQAVSNRKLVNVLEIELDEGEAEAIALAVEIKAQLLFIDERRGRSVAKRLGIDVVGTLGILVEAKQKGLIPALRPLLDDLLMKAGFRISQQLYARVLEAVQEAT